VLLTGLGAESIEQCHRRSSLTRAGQLVTRFSRSDRRTPMNLEPELGTPNPFREFLQPLGDIGAVGRGTHFLVDVQNVAVASDVDRPP